MKSSLTRARAFRQIRTRLASSKAGIDYELSYECSRWAIPDMECALLEKSLNAGYRSIVTRSSPHVATVFDKIAAIKKTQEASYSIHHLLATGKDGSWDAMRDRWSSELALLAVEPLASSLQTVLIQMPQDILSDRGKLSNTLEGVLQGNQAALRSSKVGLMLDTAQLSAMQADAELKEKITTNLLSLYDKYDVLRAAGLSCNMLCSPAALALAPQLTADRPLHIFGMELFRTQSSKPGQLSTSYDYHLPHMMDREHSLWAEFAKVLTAEAAGTTAGPGTTAVDSRTSSSSPFISNVVHNDIREAALDCKIALERCCQLELGFMEKHREGLSWSEDALRMCVGHILLAPSMQFEAPEEFDLVVHLQIWPQADERLTRMRDSGGALKDWALLYRPCAFYLLCAYRHLMQVQVLDKARQLQGQGTESLPYVMARHAAHALGASTVGMTLTKMDKALDESSRRHTEDGATALAALHAEMHNQFIQ